MVLWSPGISLDELERMVIEKSISFFGSKEKAALSLRISVKDILKKTSKWEEEDKILKEKRDLEKEKQANYLLHARGKLPQLT